MLGFALTTVSGAWGQSGSVGSSVLSLTVSAESAIRLDVPRVALARLGGKAFGGDTSLTWKVRTQTVGGSGDITVKLTSAFPTGSSSAADELTFECMAASRGAGCTGSQFVSATRAVTVVRFNSGAHSAPGGDSGSIRWKLKNEPPCGEETCEAIATFTISSN